MRKILESTLDTIVCNLDKVMSDDLSLVNGKIGMLLFYAYLFLDETNDVNRVKVQTLLSEILSGFDKEEEIDLSYANGITGLMSVIAHFKKEEKLSFLQAIIVDDIHEPIFHQAKKWIEQGFIDNLYGAVGIIHYFNQLDDPSSEKYLSGLIDILIAKAITIDGDKIYFATSFPTKENESLDFGFAHGMSGLLGVLLEVYEKQKFREVLYPIITSGIHYILDSKIAVDPEFDNYSLFPASLDLNTQEYTISNRLGWCYGDLNQVLLLYKAGKSLQRDEYAEYAEIFGMATLSRKTEISTRVSDSTFCHGASGLAFLYFHLFQVSGDSKYLEAYEIWMNKAIQLFELEMAGNTYRHATHTSSLLDGLPGIGLVLLSSKSSNKLSWSKLLFI